MAGLGGTITVEGERRPCLVEGKPALWHRWTSRCEIVPPSIYKGGHLGGNIAACFALVEFEDGAVAEVNPERVRFLDTAAKLADGLGSYFTQQEAKE